MVEIHETAGDDLYEGETRSEIEHRAGQGNWRAFRALSLDMSLIRDAARKWQRQLASVELPWLCWNVSADWCLVQQRLIELTGWTPVVGFDPRVGPPSRLSPKAIVVDFNDGLGLPVLYPHFPLEFVFLFTKRLAFWHSDLLIRRPLMSSLGRQFAEQPDGSTSVTASSPGLRHLLWYSKTKRHFELVGCTTKGASQSQFDNGCGWWMEFWHHPNCPSSVERQRRARNFYWDHGAGIYFWDKVVGGNVRVLKESKLIHQGHFTKIRNKDYVRTTSSEEEDSQRLMAKEIDDNFDLDHACRQMGLESLLSGK